METCTIETGLFKKKPCGATAVTHCKNCEQPLCSKHATPQMSDGKKIFLCEECAKAWIKNEKEAKAAAAARQQREIMQGGGAKKPAPRPVSHTPTPTPAAKPAQQPAPTAKKPEAEHSGPLEFTPSKKPDPKK